MTEISELTCEHWQKLVGSEFHLQVEGQSEPLALVLTEAEFQRGYDPERSTRQPFALLFSGPLERALPQQTSALSHPEFGKLELFLVPIGPEGDAMQYEAIFN